MPLTRGSLALILCGTPWGLHGGGIWVQGKCRAQDLFAAVIDEDVLRYQFVKKKGYVRLHTNKGDLNLELHCDLVSVMAVHR